MVLFLSCGRWRIEKFDLRLGLSYNHGRRPLLDCGGRRFPEQDFD
jgi:hypothetical protein